jgi:uncharacterized protein (TIGR02594 family)
MSYEWLHLEPSPRHLLKAVELLGIREVVGTKHNPVIMSWAEELSLTQYTADETPWCGLFMAIIMKRSERITPKNPLWALSWADWGVAVVEPMLGDVLTFKRNGGGHVGLYVGEDKYFYHVLGGNQGNSVSIVRIDKTRLYKPRRPAYSVTPWNVRKILLPEQGAISTNEG